MENTTKEVLEHMVNRGHVEAKFGKLENAMHFKHLLKSKRNIDSKLTERLGHATTIDTPRNMNLHKHFHVQALHDAAHRVLGKFM